ncbi:putative E3 ubiquitin-protein ligase MGRN1 isoform X1 [Tubulanus polymorphus]|uniref:putative E3 ubiquitin-protein ligase MGRN1 isoform X1 n=1 Tax=Tubulanus polymorphus TaxID=672921 RepID=UPI003DA375B1
MKMGAFISSDNAGVEEVNIPNVNAYRYPPKCGNYFGSHFIMGGERFDTIQPEAYLFGENQDLNFLGKRPVPFPYPAPQGNEPTKTLRSLVNIRKDSLRFVKSQNHTMKPEDSTEPQTKYNIEFTFDADARCAITIFYFTSEEVIDGRIIYHPRDSAMNSETFHYKRGANQTFSQPTHVIDPSKFSEEELQYNLEAGTIPIVIQCVVEDEEDHIGHAHMTFGVVDKNSDNTYTLKPLKQKQMVDGLCYLLQEIYGIENKNCELTKSNQEDEFEDTGSECVICMSESRDTLILPCRHLCLCSACANNLRYQANNCPICRAPFRALLQIRAMKKKSLTNNLQPQRHHQSNSDDDDCCSGISQEGVPHGYEAVSLIEALNGPPRLPPPPPNPLHLPPEGLPPPGRPSLLNSPSDSPPVDRKKALKRQPSVGSTSLREAVVPEEAEYAGESESSPLEESDEIETGRGTPEVVMLGQAPDPSKSPGKQPIKFKLPKVRYSNTNGILQAEAAVIHKIYLVLEEMMKKVLVCFLKPSAFTQTGAASPFTVDFTSRYNIKNTQEIIIGDDAKIALAAVHDDVAKEFYKRVVAFYQAACTYMVANINPRKQPLWKNAEVADIKIRATVMFASLVYFFDRYSAILGDWISRDDVEMEFADYQTLRMDELPENIFSVPSSKPGQPPKVRPAEQQWKI